MENKKIFMILVIAILLLVAGYLYKGAPMLASLIVGYYFIYKAFLRKLEKEEELRILEMERKERF